jgi:hypothetical protein
MKYYKRKLKNTAGEVVLIYGKAYEDGEVIPWHSIKATYEIKNIDPDSGELIVNNDLVWDDEIEEMEIE